MPCAGSGQHSALIQRQVGIESAAQPDQAVRTWGLSPERAASGDDRVPQGLSDEQVPAPLHLLPRRTKLQAAKPTAGTMKKAPRVKASRTRKDRPRLRQRGGRRPHSSHQLGEKPEQREDGGIEQNHEHAADEKRDRSPRRSTVA